MLFQLAVNMALITAKCFSSSQAVYTPLFDPSSAKGGAAVYDSSPANSTRLEGNEKDVFGDAFESNNTYKTAFNVTPDQAYLDQSYYVMAPNAYMSNGDVDWFSFSVLADSLVTINVVLHTGYLTSGYEFNLYYSDIYTDDPNSYCLFSTLTNLCSYKNRTSAFSEPFTLRAGYYFVEIVGGSSGFNYDFVVKAQYMKRDALDISYASSFESAGAAYWESDFFPFHKFDVESGTYREHGLTSERFLPNGVYEPMLTKLKEITGETSFMSTALIVWEPALRRIVYNELKQMINIYSTALSNLQSEMVEIQTAAAAGGVVLNILSKAIPVYSVFFETANAIVSTAASILLRTSAINADELRDEISNLGSVANLLVDMLPDEEDKNDDATEFESFEVIVLPLVWSFSEGNGWQRVSYFFPNATLPANVDKFYKAESYVIPAKPKNAMGRGNFWILDRNAISTLDGFDRALKWEGSYSYNGFALGETLDTPYGKISLLDHDDLITPNQYSCSVSLRGGYDHQVIAFRPLKSGFYSAVCPQYPGLEIDVFNQFPTTPDCTDSIAQLFPKTLSTNRRYDFYALANRIYYVRIHDRKWGSSPNSQVGTGLNIFGK